MTFNLHGNKTADGVVIAPGLAVFTNDLTVGHVTRDTNETNMCCHYEAHTDGQIVVSGGVFTNHAFGCVVPDCNRCRHNHWFAVRMPDGTTVSSWDGERLTTRLPGSGKRATDAIREAFNV